MPIKVKHNGEWKEATFYTKKSENYEEEKQIFYKKNGSWIPLINSKASTSIKFTSSKSGSNINFFDKEGQVLNPDNYVVYINGKKTNQNIDSISFNANDLIEIKVKSNNYYPYFYCNDKDYIKEINSPLPLMKLNENTLAEDFSYEFYNCSSLVSIPEDIFINNPQAKNFSHAFESCTGLTNISSNLSSNNQEVTDFSHTFKNCSAINEIPENLFSNNPEVTTFESTFESCHGLTSIPESLFANNTKVTNFDKCFYNCINITSNAPSLKETHPNASIIDCFTGTNISNKDLIPLQPLQPFSEQSIKFKAALAGRNINFFDYTGDTQFNTPAQTLPELDNFTVFINEKSTTQKINNLSFNENDIVEIKCNNEDSYYPYFYCNSDPKRDPSYDPDWSIKPENWNKPSPVYIVKNYIKEILKPLPLMKLNSNTEVTNFSYCFALCRNLTSIPENLFSNNTEVTNFSCCFTSCESLTSIPENLFSNNTKVTSFSYCFANCDSLTSIPENLFSNNTEVTDFSYCFAICVHNLTSIPENLFSNNTKVTSFHNCFNNCYYLTSIPENLFKYNTEVTDFSYCFGFCQNLTSIPENLFSNNTKVTDFSSCFSYCYSLTGNAPDLWNTHTKVNESSMCFGSCTKLSNYASIPDTWK